MTLGCFGIESVANFQGCFFQSLDGALRFLGGGAKGMVTVAATLSPSTGGKNTNRMCPPATNPIVMANNATAMAMVK
ncbi:MAG: hypothetical protein CM1200mP29_06680 [Verrucomicrobiota bacterium]|nr:MAG: hypothetical protein CM1200mP29_06680 [Verrucomicrobiota bacterium]